jgi:hypothetical protein
MIVKLICNIFKKYNHLGFIGLFNHFECFSGKDQVHFQKLDFSCNN